MSWSGSTCSRVAFVSAAAEHFSLSYGEAGVQIVPEASPETLFLRDFSDLSAFYCSDSPTSTLTNTQKERGFYQVYTCEQVFNKSKRIH